MSESVELRHLRYFVAVAEELSFRLAAERLGIAQPSLSLQIQALERVVGAALLERRPQVRLTEAGEALLVHARPVLAQTDEAILVTRRVAEGKAGVLRLGVVPSVLLASPLSRAIRRFREEHGGVELRLWEMSTAHQFAALRAERIDVGLLREPPGDVEFLCETVTRERLLAVLPSAHPLAASSVVDLSALAQEPWIFFPRSVNPQLHDHFRLLFSQAGFTPQVVQEIAEFQAGVSLVEAGLGVAIVPAGVRHIRVPGVVYRAIRGLDARTRIALCWRQDRSSPLVLALRKLLPNTRPSGSG